MPTKTDSFGPVSANSPVEGASQNEDSDLTNQGLDTTVLSGPQPGDLLFGKYRVESLLGRGGMGEVWLVRHEILRDQFALKLIVPGAAIDEETVHRFVLEARVMRALSRHPHAVVVHDADIDQDWHVIYIVMDVVHGDSIEKLLRPGEPMPLDWTAQVLGQLCDVLGHAHERGIVHRDLSPANLMLEHTPDGRVYLRVLDFGVAKVLDPEAGVFNSLPLTEYGRFFGKRSYASPEQLNGEHVDRRSDLYSIGVILYEFLTGFRPFHGNAAKLLKDHCFSDPPRFAQLNPNVNLPEIEQVVRRCLEKDPNNRPQSAPELVDLFRAALQSSATCPQTEMKKEKVEPAPLISGEALPALPARRTWLLIGAAILVCTALAMLLPARFTPVSIPQKPFVSAPEVIEFLKGQELQTTEGSAVAAGGWPRIIERPADRRRLVWHQGVYLPEGYEPDSQLGKAGLLPLVLVHKNGSRFLLIEGGEFVMGAFDSKNNEFCPEEKPGHRVRLSSFYMQETEVTCNEFERFCMETGRSRNDTELKDSFFFACNARSSKMTADELRKHPAVGVMRKLAAAYAHHVGGELPSEAQWEFAARSRGKNQLYVWGVNELPNNANLHQAIVVGIETWPVGLSTDDRTEQGVLDLAGNAREWCRDAWKFYPQVEPAQDPVQVPAKDDSNPLFVIRGGSYNTPPETARVTWRSDLPGADSLEYKAHKDFYENDLGFRIVLEIVEVPQKLIEH
jgi:serine/threonine-protein kinase